MNVLRAYPVSFAYIDLLDHPPTADEVLARVKLVYQGAATRPGCCALLLRTWQRRKFPGVPRFLRIHVSQLKPEALEMCLGLYQE